LAIIGLVFLDFIFFSKEKKGNNFCYSEAKVLARIEVHIEVVVIAFAFIMEDFAELFVEYFC